MRNLGTGILLFAVAISVGAWLGQLIWPEDPYFAAIHTRLSFAGKLLSYANFR